MPNLILAMIVVLVLPAAAYVHIQLPGHRIGRRQVRIARIVLAVTGVAFAWVVARVYGAIDGISAPLAFVAAFGVVHVPAAAILFAKSMTPEGDPPDQG